MGQYVWTNKDNRWVCTHTFVQNKLTQIFDSEYNLPFDTARAVKLYGVIQPVTKQVIIAGYLVN